MTRNAMFATIEASALAAFALQDAQQLLYREARALDDRDWDAWLALYAPDAEFWMPSWDDNDRLGEDPPAEMSLRWDGRKGGREDRVFRIGVLPGARSHSANDGNETKRPSQTR